MITFYPGPSKVYSQVPQYIREGYDEGILSINHRSPAFLEMCERVVHLIKHKMHVPEDYMILFASSATECWEIISQSIVQHHSHHLYNGAFGQKWFSYAQKLQPDASGQVFDREASLGSLPLEVPEQTELIAVTHNETSNATAVSMEDLQHLRTQFPDTLLAVDATSSMAGVHLDFSLADIWYASVQKCFGLPAGLAVLICSPAALQKARQTGEHNHYNSLLYMAEQMENWQTTYTPNVMNIYLLMRTLEESPTIERTEHILEQRYQKWLEQINRFEYASMLIQHEAVRSKTVLALQAQPEIIGQIKNAATGAGITLGNGYGDLKPTTLRIANFPAIEEDEIAILQSFLASFRPV